MGAGFPAFGADALRFTLVSYSPQAKRIALAPTARGDLSLAIYIKPYAAASQETAATKALYGLEGGLGEQYAAFWRRVLVGDFGPSLSAFPTPVPVLIGRALPWTVAASSGERVRRSPHAPTSMRSTLRVTVPVNPLIPATVTVEVGDWPALTAAGDVALMVKSWNRRTTVAECSRDPLEPVIVSV